MPPLADIKILKNSSFKKPVVVVGRNVAKKAVERNFLKRRIRAILRPIIKEKKEIFLIRVRPEAAQASFAELKSAISEKLKSFSK